MDWATGFGRFLNPRDAHAPRECRHSRDRCALPFRAGKVPKCSLTRPVLGRLQGPAEADTAAGAPSHFRLTNSPPLFVFQQTKLAPDESKVAVLTSQASKGAEERDELLSWPFTPSFETPCGAKSTLSASCDNGETSRSRPNRLPPRSLRDPKIRFRPRTMCRRSHSGRGWGP